MVDRFTVRLDEANGEWIAEQATERDRSRAWVIEECVKLARGDDSVYADGPVRTGAPHTDAVQRLERRLDELEARLDPGEAMHDLDVDRGPEPTPERSHAAGEDTTEREPQLTPPSEPPIDPDDVDPDAPLVEAEGVVRWLRENEPAERSEIVEACFDDSVLKIKPDSWWRRRIRPELEAAGAEFTRNVGWWFPDR